MFALCPDCGRYFMDPEPKMHQLSSTMDIMLKGVTSILCADCGRYDMDQ